LLLGSILAMVALWEWSMTDLVAIYAGMFRGMEQLIFLMLLLTVVVTWVGFLDYSRDERLLLTYFL